MPVGAGSIKRAAKAVKSTETNQEAAVNTAEEVIEKAADTVVKETKKTPAKKTAAKTAPKKTTAKKTVKETAVIENIAPEVVEAVLEEADKYVTYGIGEDLPSYLL